jgi:nucleoside phosphorylase
VGVTSPAIGAEELVVHAFYLLDGPTAEESYHRVRALWEACRPLMGRPVMGTGLPTDLPAEHAALPAEVVGEVVIAGQESVDSDCQAILRHRHDTLHLSVAFGAYTYDSTRSTQTRRPPLPGRDMPPGWADFDRHWEELVGGESVGGTGGLLLGEARLYLGTVPVAGGVEASVPLAQAAGRLLPPVSQQPGWWTRGATTVAGFAVWEASPLIDSRVLRRIVVLGPADRDPELSAWVWSTGDPAAPPLARYLLHAAKLRHQVRVWNQGRDLARLRGRIADSVVRLQASAGEAAEGVVGNGEPGTEARPGAGDGEAGGRADGQGAGDRDTDGRQQEATLRAVEIDAATVLAALPAMKRTVQIAADNMARTLAGSVPDGAGADLFGDDRDLSRWFEAQLDDEIAYLESDRDLLRQVGDIVTRSASADAPHSGLVSQARAVTNQNASRVLAGGLRAVSTVAAASATIGILTAMPEEFHAMRTLLEHLREASAPLDFARYLRGTLPSRDAARPHQVVLTQTGDTGTSAAADAATNLSRSFPTVDCLLMVGIAAGVPDLRVPQRHVRLGDIVVATWGIVDYAHVVVRAGRVELRQPFPRPWQLLRRVASTLQADELRGDRPWEQWLDIAGNRDLAEYGRPPDTTDVLTPPAPGSRRPRHPSRAHSGHRPGLPKVHHGLIGSANISLRDAELRDQLATEHHLRAFEMEGAGVGTSAFLNDRHWFMVRGISDYADRGFGTTWRKYASLTATAYVRALLGACQPIGPDPGRPS